MSKVQLSKITQSGSFLGALLSKIAGPLMEVTVLLTNNILALQEVTAAALAKVVGIQKKIYGSGMTTLIVSSKEMRDIMKIVKALEDFVILLKGITKTIENESKEKKVNL